MAQVKALSLKVEALEQNKVDDVLSLSRVGGVGCHNPYVSPMDPPRESTIYPSSFTGKKLTAVPKEKNKERKTKEEVNINSEEEETP